MKKLFAMMVTAAAVAAVSPATAHVPGGKFSALPLREKMDRYGHFGVTIKVWNYTPNTRRVRVVVEMNGSGVMYTPSQECYPSFDPLQPPTCYPTTESQFIEVATKIGTTIKVPGYGSARKRIYGNFAGDWGNGVEDPYVWGDLVHVHRVG
jgi:hypothetical protein